MIKIEKSHSKTKKKAASNDVDKVVGSRLKLRRNIIGMSQNDLAKEVGISFQQIQKYEKGSNRISASRLYEISKVLNVPVSFFFDDMSESNKKTDYTSKFQKSAVNKSESLELVKNFWELSPKSRKNLISLLKSLAKKID